MMIEVATQFNYEQVKVVTEVAIWQEVVTGIHYHIVGKFGKGKLWRIYSF